MGTLKVLFQPNGESVEAEAGERLFDIASRAGVDVNNLCGGLGVCGKCRVKVLRGKAKFSAKHLGFLERKELDAGYVLACQAEVLEEDVEIWVPPEARKEEEQILMVDSIVQYEPPTPLESGPAVRNIPYFRPISRKYYLELPKPSLTDNLSDLERIYRELRKKLGDVRIQVDGSCLRTLSRLVRESDWKITATVHLRNLECPRIRVIEGGNTSARNFGVAIDVGTTTIVAQLIDLRTGVIMGVEGSHNRQARYGEDVISRMVFACGRGGLNPLTEAVITTINSLVNSLVAGSGALHEEIACFVASGNTTMTHLLLGMEPCTIRIAPYIPTASRFPPMPAEDIGLKAHSGSVLHCMPCVSSYVGGDITAGVLACGMNDQPQISALIDVGTNGEIVIGNSDWLVCCSASAGPAFEGGGIKCGMRATRGAVEKVSIEGGEVVYKTIGQAKPRGVCGSGLIDTIAELLAEQVIDQSGKFVDHHPRVQVVDEVPEFIIAPGTETETGDPVVVTEDDIGNLIKSKGAMLAAMKVLLKNMGMSFGDLEQIYVAGGFGTHLDIDKAIFIGLLPDIPQQRIRFIGNSSLAGSRQALLSVDAFHKAETIAKQMTYFELSVHPEFMSEFVACLFLPHTQMELFPSVRDRLAQRRCKH